MFLKWRHSSPIFRYAVNFIGHGQSGKLKLDNMAKSIGIYFFWFEYILDVIEIPKPTKTFWRYGHFNYNILDGRPLWLYHFICLALHENENKTS